MKFVIICSLVVYSHAFVVSQEALQLQAAAIGTKIVDTQEAVQEVVQAVGDGVSSAVNSVVTTKNQAQAAATEALQNGVAYVQSSLGKVAAATGEAGGKVYAVVRDATGKVVDVVLFPIRYVGEKATKKYTLIADGFYKLTHPVPKEVAKVPAYEETVYEVPAYETPVYQAVPESAPVASPYDGPNVPVEIVYPSGSYHKHHNKNKKPVSYVNKDGDYATTNGFPHQLLTQDGVEFIELPDDWEVVSFPGQGGDFYRNGPQEAASEVKEVVAETADKAVDGVETDAAKSVGAEVDEKSLESVGLDEGGQSIPKAERGVKKRNAIFYVPSMDQAFYTFDDFRDETNLQPLPDYSELDLEYVVVEEEEEFEKGTLKMRLLFTVTMLLNKVLFVAAWLIG